MTESSLPRETNAGFGTVSTRILSVVTDAVANQNSVKDFAAHIARDLTPDVAHAVHVSTQDVEFTKGTIPSALNTDGFTDSLAVTEELGKTTLTIPVPPNGRIVLYDIDSDDIDMQAISNVGEIVGELFPSLREERLEQQRRDFMELHRVAARMMKSDSVDDVLQLAADAAERIIEFDQCRVYARDSDEFHVVVSRKNEFSDDTSVLDAETVVQYSIENNKRVLVDDVRHYDMDIGLGERYRSGVFAPIGEYGVFVAVSTAPDAFTELDGDIADLLMAYVAQTLQRIRSANELQAVNEQLAEQNEELEVLNRIVRHDIRNDMQLVLGMSDVLRDRVDGDAERYVKNIEESAEHVVELTASMRDLVDAMIADDDEAAVGSVTLSSVLVPEIEDIRGSYESDEVVINQPMVPDVEVTGDDMLASVFRNLLRNAVDHCDKDVAQIEVEVEHDVASDRVRVRVRDNGPGIPDAKKDAIFGKDIKGEDSSGTGVGLYLVQTLVDRYGGDVWVADNEPDGAVFTVELQVA